MTTTACTTFRATDGEIHGVASITDGLFTTGSVSNAKTSVIFSDLKGIDAAISVLAQLRDAVAEAQGVRLS